MKNISMKRILPLLMIAFIASCGNQQTKDSTGVDKDKEGVLSMEVVEEPSEGLEVSIDKNNPGTVTITPPGEGQTQAGADDMETSVIFKKGTTAYANQDFEGGIAYFQQIVEKEPDNRKAYYNLGVGYYKLDKFYESLQSFNRAIEIMPRDSISIQFRGKVYYIMGNYEKCLIDYERVLEMNPDDPGAWYSRGTVRGKLKDYNGALKDFDRAIELNPKYADAYFNRAMASYFLGRLHDACADWNTAHGLGHFDAEKAIKTYCENNSN
jgi:tetratricopeptide (TPR) repeat protein